MMVSVANLAGTFNNTMSPKGYIEQNALLWNHCIAKLSPLQPVPERRKHLAYPFTTILNDISIQETCTASPAGSLHPLLEVEQSTLGMTNPSIDTLTFFEGEPPLTLLKERLAAMAAANPWLAGRLRSGADGAVLLWVPDAADAKISLGEETKTGLRADMPPLDAIRACSSLRVKLGIECVDQEEALLKICLLRTGTRQFALLFSMSHVLGDAATASVIYAMLDPAGTAPAALDYR